MTGVLLSAGLDSAVLAAAEARNGEVQPIYVATGLAWEASELATLDQLLATVAYERCLPVAILSFPVSDLYPPTHWALRGEAPAFDTPDTDVYLTGRNIILLSKAGVFAAQHQLSRLAIGPLADNPFPDATPEFFDAMGKALSLGLARPIAIDRPFAAMDKSAVIRLGVQLRVPLELTLSCMSPAGALHCGKCSKCRERRDAFRTALVPDPTRYAAVPAR